jgi:hypothetical protein
MFVRFLQLGRARRLHVVTHRPELELAEVERFPLPGVEIAAARLYRGVSGCIHVCQRLVQVWRIVTFSARICSSRMNPSPLAGSSG